MLVSGPRIPSKMLLTCCEGKTLRGATCGRTCMSKVSQTSVRLMCMSVCLTVVFCSGKQAFLTVTCWKREDVIVFMFVRIRFWLSSLARSDRTRVSEGEWFSLFICCSCC